MHYSWDLARPTNLLSCLHRDAIRRKVTASNENTYLIYIRGPPPNRVTEVHDINSDDSKVGLPLIGNEIHNEMICNWPLENEDTRNRVYIAEYKTIARRKLFTTWTLMGPQ